MNYDELKFHGINGIKEVRLHPAPLEENMGTFETAISTCCEVTYHYEKWKPMYDNGTSFLGLLFLEDFLLYHEQTHTGESS